MLNSTHDINNWSRGWILRKFMVQGKCYSAFGFKSVLSQHMHVVPCTYVKCTDTGMKIQSALWVSWHDNFQAPLVSSQKHILWLEKQKGNFLLMTVLSSSSLSISHPIHIRTIWTNVHKINAGKNDWIFPGNMIGQTAMIADAMDLCHLWM